MEKVKHENNGRCIKCEQIFRRYGQFNIPLETWFKRLQFKHKTAHISAAGRGEHEQTELQQRGASRAYWGQSAHNYAAAIDVFFLIDGKYCADRDLYDNYLKPELNVMLNWYGKPGASFPELPHVELVDWKAMAKQGLLRLVE